jgi:hypothetical protein
MLTDQDKELLALIEYIEAMLNQARNYGWRKVLTD